MYTHMTYIYIHICTNVCMCVRKSPRNVKQKEKGYGKQKMKNKITIRSIL